MPWRRGVLIAVLVIWWQTRQPQLLGQAQHLGLGLLALLALLGAWWCARSPALPRTQAELAAPTWSLARSLPRQGCAQVLGLVAVALLALLWVEARAGWRLAQTLPSQLEGVELLAEGVVAELPRHSEQGSRFRFALEAVQDPRGKVPPELLQQVPREVLLSWWMPPAPPRAGERWRLTVRLRAPRALLNPGGFDYEQYLFEEGIRVLGSVRSSGSGGSGAQTRLLCTGTCAPLARLREHLRDALTQALQVGGKPARHLPTLLALAVGDQSGIAAQDWELYRRIGITHLISISGLHITMFAWLVTLGIGWLWGLSARWRMPLALHLPRQVAAGLGGFAAGWGYALLSGMQTPAARTVIMLGVAVLSRLLARRLNPMDVWHAALAAVVVADPWAVMQPGFWLSFLGVAILFGAELEASHGWRARLVAMLKSQLLVSLAIVPFTALYFQQLSVVAPVANLLAVTPFSLVITPLAVLPLLLPAPLADWLWWLAHALLAALLALLHVAFAQAPVWWVALPGMGQAALALLGAVLLALRWPWPLRWTGVALMLPALLTQPSTPDKSGLEVWFADVGQGGGVLLRTQSHAMLFDAGPRYGMRSNSNATTGADAGARVLVPLLRALGVRQLDGIVASHRDSDHVGGLVSVLHDYPGTPVWSSMTRAAWLESYGVVEPTMAASASSTPSTTTTVTPSSAPAIQLAAITDDERAAKAGQALARLPGAWLPCERGQSWEWDGVRFAMLWPLSSPLPQTATTRANSNARSCVLWVQAPGLRLLLSADLGVREEAALLALPDFPQVEVLQVGHHGSRFSSSAAWLAALHASLGVIQVGATNSFGHPHPDTLARLQAANMQALRTDRCGAIRVQTLASQTGWFWSSQRAESPRYWRAAPDPTCQPQTSLARGNSATAATADQTAPDDDERPEREPALP